MILLITYVTIALLFSFLCSIAEAVILSVSPAHIALLEKEGKPSGKIMRLLKEDISKPLGYAGSDPRKLLNYKSKAL